MQSLICNGAMYYYILANALEVVTQDTFKISILSACYILAIALIVNTHCTFTILTGSMVLSSHQKLSIGCVTVYSRPLKFQLTLFVLYSGTTGQLTRFDKFITRFSIDGL